MAASIAAAACQQLKTDLYCMQACIGKVRKLAKLSTDSKTEIGRGSG